MRTLLTALAFSIGAASFASAAELNSIEIISPAGPGGGYDQLARTTQNTLQELGLAKTIQVVNKPGAGGTLGLAEFVSRNKTGTNLIATGIGMVGSILTTNSAVKMSQARPLARVTGEYLTIVVGKDSKLKTMADFAELYKKDPGALSLGGFAVGGSDHLLYGAAISSFGGDVGKMNYVAIGAGGEMLAQVIGGHIATGAGGYNEFADQIKSGNLRALGISSPERLPGVDIPTMKEQGYDVDLVNWRGFLAPADISDADRATLDDTFKKMVASEQWKKLLAERGWSDLYLDSDGFAAFLKEEEQEVAATLKSLKLIN